MSNTSDESRASEALRARHEPHLMDTFHEKRVLFQEGDLRFHATAHLEIDEWGVKVYLGPETDLEPLTVSGAWEILSVWANGLGAAYVSWGISAPEQET
jgi:hypothetical protein